MHSRRIIRFTSNICAQGALLNSAALAAARHYDVRRPIRPAASSNAIPIPASLPAGCKAWRRGSLLTTKFPGLSLDAVRQSLRNCFRELNRLAVTSVGDLHTGGVNFAHRRLLADMARTGDYQLAGQFLCRADEPGDEIEQLKMAAEEIKGLHQR